MHPKRKKRIIAITAAALVTPLLAGTVALYCLSASIYKQSFDYRCTTSAESAFSLSDFPTLTRERHTFPSDKGQTLVGYLYRQSDSTSPEKGVILFAHGLGGGGQTGYMDLFDYMTAQGYFVFAYDATGNDESEGEVIGGLPQGIIDADYALNYAYTIDEIKDLPFVLMGYSWGAMSVSNLLCYHPEVKAVAALAGWNDSMDLIEQRGVEVGGSKAKLLLPFASLYEHMRYGKYASACAMKGFAKSDCAVMIVHGELDETVPIGYGYEAYYQEYGNSDRFVFKKYVERDHGVMTTYNGKLDLALMAEIAAFFDQSIAK